MASVIKSNSRTGQPIVFNFQDVAQEATRFVGSAQGKAAALMADANRQAADVRRKAEEEGRHAAMRAAENVLDQKVEQKMTTLLPALAAVVQELNDAKQAWLRHWEHSTVLLATKIAQRIVRRELKQQPDIALELVREALELAAGSPSIRLMLSPTDYETLGGNVERLAREICPAAATTIVPDAAISPGGCRLETRHGTIDQQLETQLARIAEELNGDE